MSQLNKQTALTYVITALGEVDIHLQTTETKGPFWGKPLYQKCICVRMCCFSVVFPIPTSLWVEFLTYIDLFKLFSVVFAKKSPLCA